MAFANGGNVMFPFLGAVNMPPMFLRSNHDRRPSQFAVIAHTIHD